MNATVEQIKPETISLLEEQAKRCGLSVDEFLKNLLTQNGQELALEPETKGAATEQTLLAAETPEEREAKRQKSIAWITSHREEYGGKYVALDGDKLIAVGDRQGDALKLAIKAGYKKPFVGLVYPENYVAYWGGWD